MRRILAILLILFSGWAYVYSQTSAKQPSEAEIHRMNAAILSTLDEYIQCTSLSEASDVYVFPALFVAADKVCVYNDVPGTTGYDKMISPADYAKLITPGSGCLIQSEVSTVRKAGAYTFDGKYWHRPISLDKYVMFIDNTVYQGNSGGVFFDSDYLFGKGRGLTHLVLDMCYDTETGRCLIASITNQGGEKDTPVAQDSFYVVLKSDNPKIANPKYEGRTLYKGQPLAYNDYGQAFVGDAGEIAFADENYEIRVTEHASSPLYKVVTLGYHRFHHLRIKPRFSTTLGSAFYAKKSPLEGEGSLKVTSHASEFGLDLGSMFVSGNGFRAGLYTGAALSTSHFTAYAPEEFSYSYFRRTYDILSAQETVRFLDAVVPLYVETEFSLGDMVGLSLDLGAKAYLNLNNKDYYSVTYRSGYPQIDHTLNSEDNGFLFPASYAKEAFDLSFFANLEADVHITGILWGFLAAGYEYGLPPLGAYRPKDAPQPYFSDPVYPVVRIGTEDVMRHSYLRSVSLNRQSAWLSIGIKVKLKY